MFIFLCILISFCSKFIMFLPSGSNLHKINVPLWIFTRIDKSMTYQSPVKIVSIGTPWSLSSYTIRNLSDVNKAEYFKSCENQEQKIPSFCIKPQSVRVGVPMPHV